VVRGRGHHAAEGEIEFLVSVGVIRVLTAETGMKSHDRGVNLRKVVEGMRLAANEL